MQKVSNFVPYNPQFFWEELLNKLLEFIHTVAEGGYTAFVTFVQELQDPKTLKQFLESVFDEFSKGQEFQDGEKTFKSFLGGLANIYPAAQPARPLAMTRPRHPKMQRWRETT